MAWSIQLFLTAVCSLKSLRKNRGSADRWLFYDYARERLWAWVGIIGALRFNFDFACESGLWRRTRSVSCSFHCFHLFHAVHIRQVLSGGNFCRDRNFLYLFSRHFPSRELAQNICIWYSLGSGPGYCFHCLYNGFPGCRVSLICVSSTQSSWGDLLTGCSVSLHNALNLLHKAITLPREDSPNVRRDLVWNMTNLSDSVRDLTLDLSITRFRPSDARALRNLIQGAMRSVLSIMPDTDLFNVHGHGNMPAAEPGKNALDQVVVLIAQYLAEPTRNLIDAMLTAVKTCDAALMDISGYRRYLGPSPHVSADALLACETITVAMEAFKAADEALLRDPKLPEAYSNHPEVVKLLLFVHPVQMTAERIRSLARKVSEMKGSSLRVHILSYPFVKSLSRTNAQVRHDRGGLGAGFYFRSKRVLQRTIDDLQSRPYIPLRYLEQDIWANKGHKRDSDSVQADPNPEGLQGISADPRTIRYKLWRILHHLQGFESRFALKMVIATTTMATPAWLSQSRTWYTANESWWAVVLVWLLMDPRVRYLDSGKSECRCRKDEADDLI